MFWLVISEVSVYSQVAPLLRAQDEIEHHAEEHGRGRCLLMEDRKETEREREGETGEQKTETQRETEK